MKYIKKGYRKPRAAPKRKPAYKRRATASNKASFAKKVMAVVNVKADKKQTIPQTINDTFGQFRAVTGTTFTEAYSLIPLLTVSTGTSDQSRVGNKIHLTGAQIRLQMTGMLSTSGQINGQKFRVIIFAEKGITTGAPALGNFLVPDPVYGTTSYLSDRNPDYFQQFKVICDKKFTMPLKQLASQVVIRDVKINLRLNHDQHYYGTSSASSVDNAMYMLLISDSGNTNTVLPYIGAVQFPVTGNSSGLNVVGYITQYFTDV